MFLHGNMGKAQLVAYGILSLIVHIRKVRQQKGHKFTVSNDMKYQIRNIN